MLKKKAFLFKERARSDVKNPIVGYDGDPECYTNCELGAQSYCYYWCSQNCGIGGGPVFEANYNSGEPTENYVPEVDRKWENETV